MPELSKLDLGVLSASATSLYSDLSATKRRKLRAAKEASTHTYVHYDVWLGAVHVLLPESKDLAVDATQSVVVRLGDIAIRSNPKRVEVESSNPKRVEVESSNPKRVEAESIYDNVLVSVSSANVLRTNGEKEWMKQRNLYVVDDFNLNATIGLSIAPSEPAFATTRVAMESERRERSIWR